MTTLDEIRAQRKAMLAECRKLAGHNGPLESEIIESKAWPSVGESDWKYVLSTLDLTRDVVANLTIELRHGQGQLHDATLQMGLHRNNISALARRGLWQRLTAWWQGMP